MRMTKVLGRLALVASITSCVGGPTTASATFDLVEYDVVGPSRLHPATKAIDVTNSGEYPHTLVVTDASGEVVAASSLISPGESAELAIDLEPGRYSFTCRIVVESPEGELIDHFEKGMTTTVSVND
jgi:hypothetical protein